ncbi:MAG: tetratricopeptide repeat protein [Bacteroidetes bacterium]|nr:tetratricopeptide repeat protein [Bacteroidota bacterium]MBS1540898.1 tetratricopeptide repeat protein [Bacteroidota bacterium]
MLSFNFKLKKNTCLAGIFFFLITITPLLSVAQKPTKNQKREAQADTLMKHEDFGGAALLYSKIIDHTKEKDKKYYALLYKRALSYYRQQDVDRALNDMDAYLSVITDNSKAFLLRALINQQGGNEDQLLPDVDKAIALGNINPQLLRWRATLLLEQGKYDEARKEFLSIKNFADDPELETNLAMAYHSLNQLDSALICIQNAIELDKNFLGSYLYGASFLIDTEKYSHALDYLNQGLTIDSKNGTLWLYKGIVLIELKRTDEACSCLRKALDAGEEDAVDYLKEDCYDVYKD